MYEAGYYHHRDFSQDHIRRVRTFYLPFFHDAVRVLELGCGRGEFLEILREGGKQVVGVELDVAMAEEARGKGIEVSLTDARSYLLDDASEPFDAIIAAHLIEHLTVPEADEILRLCVLRLCRGGILCLIVPNLESFPVLTEEFWNDPTHVRPYGHELLAYLVAKHGLKVLKSGVNPMDKGGYPLDLESIETGDSGRSPLRRLPQSELGHLRHLRGVFEGYQRIARSSDAQRQVQELWQALIYVVNGLQAELADAHQRIAELNEHNLYLNHQVAVMGRNLRRLVEILYAPNEYFVISQKGSA